VVDVFASPHRHTNEDEDVSHAKSFVLALSSCHRPMSLFVVFFPAIFRGERVEAIAGSSEARR
jgi:hypothetical protein